MTRTKIALAAALLMGTATAALAETPNYAKRHPAYAGGGGAQSTPMRV